MKKLLGIVVLGLLLSGNASSATKIKENKVLFKNENVIHVVFKANTDWGENLAIKHCSSMGKSTYYVDHLFGGIKSYYKKKGIKAAFGYWLLEYECSNLQLTSSINSFNPGTNVILSNKVMNNQATNNTQGINFTISEKKQQCEAIGFTPKTEKFADCVLRLVELDMKNQQSNNMIASQNKSDSDKFMSNALINLGQQLMKPNSNIYNSNTRNCSVRKSFGNTSTVTCY